MQEDSRYTTERLAPDAVPQPQMIAVQPVGYQRNRIFAYMLIGVGLALLVRNLAFGGMGGMMGNSGHRDFKEPRGSAEHVRLQISNGNGRINLRSTDDAHVLLTGNVNYHGQLSYDIGHDDHDRTISLGTKASGWAGFVGSSGTAWNLSLNNQPVYEVQVNTGNGENTLDLSQLRVEQLKLNTGNGNTTLQLPRQGELQGTIETGNGSLILGLPQGRAARLRIEHGNGRLHAGPLSGNGASGKNGIYQTPNYDNIPAQDRIDLNIQVGNGEITVQ